MSNQTGYIDPFTLSPDERAATFDARMAWANQYRRAQAAEKEARAVAAVGLNGDGEQL